MVGDDLLSRSPFATMLGMTEVIGEAEPTFVLHARPALVGNPLLPALHGGAVAAFLEAACAIVLARAVGIDEAPRPISTNLGFLASGRVVDVVTRPAIRRLGRRVAVVHADAWQGNDRSVLICSAQCDFAR